MNKKLIIVILVIAILVLGLIFGGLNYIRELIK